MTSSHITRALDARRYHNLAPYPSAQLIPSLLPRHFSLVDRYSKGLYCGEFSADGRHFICACQSGEITVYSVETRGLHTLSTYLCRSVQWSIIDTKLSPNSKHVAYSSWSGYVHLFPFLQKTTSEIHLPMSDQVSPYHTSFCAFSLSFSADSKELIAGTTDGKVIVFDLETQSKAVSINNAHIADVNSISFSNHTNHVIYSAADDGILKIWDRRILSESYPEPVSIFLGHQHGIMYQDSKGDFRSIITSSKDQTIKLWDTRRPSRATDSLEAEQVVRSNSQLWDYRQVSGTDRQRYLQRKRASLDPVSVDDSVMTYSGHSVCSTLIRAKFSPPFPTLQKYIYTGSATGKLYIYNVLTGKIEFESSEDACHAGIVRDVSWHPHQPMVLSSSLDKTLGCTQLRDVPVECTRREQPYHSLDEIFMDWGDNAL